MMTRILTFKVWAAFFLPASLLFGQSTAFLQEKELPIEESSGLVALADGSMITHNDSGHPAALYLLSPDGEVKQVIQLPFEQVDFESIALDNDHNYLYIGDIGNNNNTRKDLKIYRFFVSDLLNNVVDQYSEILFSYPEQQHFPPINSQKYFDAEALFYEKQHLYIITKNRTEPFDGLALVYRIPAKPGNFEAVLVDTLDFSPGMIPLSWVTGVDKLRTKEQLAILLGNSIHILLDYRNGMFSDGARIEVTLPKSRQFEGIAWVNDSTLVLSCENSRLGVAGLYWLNVAPQLAEYQKLRKYEITVPEKKFKDTLWIELNAQISDKLYYEFYSSSGDRTSFGVLGAFSKGNHTIAVVPSSSEMRNGNYLLNLQFGSVPHGYFVHRFDPNDARKGLEELKEHMQSK